MTEQRRVFPFSLVIGVAFALTLSPSPGQQSPSPHPIQQLLSDSGGAIPSEDDLKPFIGSASAQEAVRQVLSTSKHAEFWSSGVISLAAISNLDGPQGLKERDRLIQFMESLEPFGCSVNCQSLPANSYPKLVRWDHEARLKVPIALGYLLRNTNPRQEAQISDLINTLSEIGKGVLINRVLCVAQNRVDESCAQTLQLNAVRGLELSGKHGAEAALDRIIANNPNPLVSREAEIAKRSYSHHQ